jgi:molybdopterin-containing oxidoreductase family iron-sulfur binding subunit
MNQNSMQSPQPNEFTPPRHWLGTEELDASYWSDEKVREKRGQEFHDKPLETLELIERLDTKGIKRRDFLTLMGASMAMASFACARRPVHKIIPYVVKPEEITGGVANYYATVCPETGYGILAKVREGRPIKLEGNPDHPMNRGALSARGQAAVLDLYDMDRAKEPMKVSRNGGASAAKWEDVDAAIAEKLKSFPNGRVRVLSGRLLSESTTRLISEFVGGFGAGSHVQFDDFSNEALAAGQLEAFGSAMLPTYRFDRADVVLSLGADFLGTWGSSEEYSSDWIKKRIPDVKNAKAAQMSKLFVVETMMSTTGANADTRMPVRPDGMLKVAAAIAGEVARRRGASAPQLASYTVDGVANDTGVPAKAIVSAAEALVAAGPGKALVVAGGLGSMTSDSAALHAVANFLNSALGAEGSTVEGGTTKTGDSLATMKKLISDMASGQVDALFLVDSNPLFTLPASWGFKDAMSKVPLVVAMNDRLDETAAASDFLLPTQHFLESWGDAQPRPGVVCIQQPTMAPIHSSRAAQDSFIAIAKAAGAKTKGLLASATSWYEYLKANWKENYLKGGSFDSSWENALRDGLVKSAAASARSGGARSFRSSALGAVPAFTSAKPGFQLALYSKSAIGNGDRANNPWLQEMPDPVTTSTWDNYFNLGPAAAQKLGVKQDDVIEVSSEGAKIALPVNIQPGLHPDLITAAIGYGRVAAGKIGNGVGMDVKGFVQGSNFAGIPVTIRNTGRRYQLAITQWHNATEDRPIVNDITLADFRNDPKMANHTDPHLRMEEVPTMWPKHKYPGYRWGMAIDLNACTGCGSCVIACQAENNIPVVGRDNVRRSREMHWMRIDRYYSGNPENPDVVFQPMLCQHCENAPCETVCPVIATNHDNEGLNVQTYNRCVGTRYCQNNCPWKVRRFNFFQFSDQKTPTIQMMRNPDVTVRSRGVMEKCTYCVQRINEARIQAEREDRPLRDGDIVTACQQACPTNAIIFGNLNDTTSNGGRGSRVRRLKEEALNYATLTELNTRPRTSYLANMRNPNPDLERPAAAGGETHG